MKLRLRGDSLRFRLTQGEVSKLHAGESVRESVHFSSASDHSFRYSIEPSCSAEHLCARFENGEILVEIPKALLELWASTDQVGVEFAQPLTEGKALRLVIEKDFRCLRQRSEDEQDNFPHPEERAGASSF